MEGERSNLEEPALDTLKAELKAVAIKIKYALLMLPKDRDEAIAHIKQWDLWGPLLICLLFAIGIGIQANEKYTYDDFVDVFAIFWIGAILASVNCRLLGNKGSIFQSVSVIGYCMLPLALLGLIIAILPKVVPIWIKLPLIIIALIWSVISCMLVMRDLVSEQKKYLAVYPVFLVYVFQAWFCIVA